MLLLTNNSTIIFMLNKQNCFKIEIQLKITIQCEGSNFNKKKLYKISHTYSNTNKISFTIGM